MNKYFLIIGLLILKTLSYADPELEIALQGPQELKFKFEGASILAPGNPDEVSSLEQTQRPKLSVWQAGRKNDLENQIIVKEIYKTTQPISNIPTSFVNLSLFAEGKKIRQKVLLDPTLNQTLNFGDYTIDVKVQEADPGSNVKFKVTLSACKKA